MDLDPLKPKNVPLAANAVLWFEFLLNPKLLEKHLENKNADPTPIELLSQFLSISREIPIEVAQISPEDESRDLTTFNQKELALKILSLKIATHIKWNLDLFEKHLPFRRQVQLMSFLCSITAAKIVTLPASLVKEMTAGPEGCADAMRFALTICYLWIVRIPVVRCDRVRNNNLILQNIQEHMRDDFYMESFASCIQTAIEYLTNVEESADQFRMPSLNTFVPLDMNTDFTVQSFKTSLNISKTELQCQINFDLCSFYLHTKKYDLARLSVLKCRDHLHELREILKSEPFYFCLVTEEKLHGLLLACGIEKHSSILLERVIESSYNKFENLIDIFKEDNLVKEIPIVNRRIVELDIQPAISCGVISNKTDIQMQAVALNTVRCLIDYGDIIPFVDFTHKYKSPKDFQALVQATQDVLNKCSVKDKLRLKNYFLNILLTYEGSVLVIEQGIRTLKLFSDVELADIKRQRNDCDIELPAIAMQTDWRIVDVKNPHLDKINIERQLLSCFTPNGIRKCLVKLAALSPQKYLWEIFQSWEIPIPLHSTLMSLQQGFLQDFAFILIGKSRELRAKKDYAGAINLLSVLRSELRRPELGANNQVLKLSKLITWELLLYQINQVLDDWPNKSSDNTELITKCKQCVGLITVGENVVPRIKIIEHGAFMLLNLNEWTPIEMLDKRFPSMKLISSFAAVALDKEKFKGNSLKCRECWDLVLTLFLHAPQNNHKSRDSPPSLENLNFNTFITRLRDPFIISLVMSLLTKLHNILKDESNLDINAEYMFFWPTSISNANAYNIKLVTKMLNVLLLQSLKFYPTNLSWIKLKGDLEFAQGNNETAMKYYVNAIITATDFCTLHPQRTLDDFIVRRMIKCSTNLGCYMQAAVLCQFLNEIDYSLAFKSISEKSTSFSDAMDAYYSCIWDPTIFEYIVNLHSKKGEHTRKLLAVNFMGQLELNSNNNEEIKHEAAEIRKTQFLRALAKQYLL